MQKYSSEKIQACLRILNSLDLANNLMSIYVDSPLKLKYDENKNAIICNLYKILKSQFLARNQNFRVNSIKSELRKNVLCYQDLVRE